MTARQSAALVVFLAAIFFAVIFFNNVTDFDSNWFWVRDLMRMQGIESTAVTYRAVKSNGLALLFYCAIIAWEGATAVVCIIGARALQRARTVECDVRARKIATLGLMMGFLLFMGGFVIVANEWFYLWQTRLGGLTTKSLAHALMLFMAVMWINIFPEELGSDSRLSPMQ